MKTILIKIAKFVVSIFEYINSKFSTNTVFYNTNDFPWVKDLEESCKEIKDEYNHYVSIQATIPYMDDLSHFQKAIVEKNKWRSLFLVCYGREAAGNILSFPKTYSLVQTIPGIRTAFFSVLDPHSHLTPHRGPYNGVLRYHLGLIIPANAEDCALSVNSEVKHWREGESLIFDDTFMHEAWNHTDEPRVILFIDFLRPLPRYIQPLNKLIVKIFAYSPFVGEIMHNIKKQEA